MKTEALRVRDPYILAENGIYYLYKTNIPHVGTSIAVHTSRDLHEWSERPVTVYSLDTSTWKEGQLWAPEVHAWNGKYYLFVSVLGKNGLRGTEISVSSTPDGTFIPLANRPATPLDQSAIDGTLFCEDGRPYIVYSRDWPHCFDEGLGSYVGEIWGCELTEDLSAPVGAAFLMFRSTDCPLSASAPVRHEWEGKSVARYGSDAPFLQRLPNGRIYLTWSPIPGGNYVVLGATADSIHGKWEHVASPVFSENGGHAMFFCDFDGQDIMCIHAPEREGDERALFLPVSVTSDGVFLK
ncbi:MAG: hypothetical protein E7643_08205 [Ruminococcaceae bacterium]|nr:hypothetical protein [Oscillospiraceae bacterium]